MLTFGAPAHVEADTTVKNFVGVDSAATSQWMVTLRLAASDNAGFVEAKGVSVTVDGLSGPHPTLHVSAPKLVSATSSGKILSAAATATMTCGSVTDLP